MSENVVINGVAYNGVDSLALTRSDGTVVTFYPDAVRYNAQTLTEAQKAQARKNIGAQAELTAADQEAIVQQVIAALGTPVFGTVDENCHINLSGKLADGKTYTFTFEDEDGTIATIGTYTKEAAPTYTNLFDPSTATLNTRMSGSSQTAKTENGYVMTTITIPASTVTGSSNTDFIVIPASMWTKSANIFFTKDGTTPHGYCDAGKTPGDVVGNWVKVPLKDQYNQTFTCIGVTLSLYVNSSAITAADIQNIEIYFNEIPE